jgi:uncharacterized protein YbjT (DUF2867 family)
LETVKPVSWTHGISELLQDKALTNSDEHKNKAYNITGPAAISNYEIAEIISNVADKKVTYVNVSVNDTRNAMKNARVGC